MLPRLRLTLLVLCACKSSGDGELRGVRYHVELQGSYSMVARNDREQVWVPSDDERPFVSVQVQPRPRESDKVIPCPTTESGGGKATGGFYFVRKGDSVDLVTTPSSVTVSAHRCLPPGEQGLDCVANYADGKMPSDREAVARAVCNSLVVR